MEPIHFKLLSLEVVNIQKLELEVVKYEICSYIIFFAEGAAQNFDPKFR